MKIRVNMNFNLIKVRPIQPQNNQQGPGSHPGNIPGIGTPSPNPYPTSSPMVRFFSIFHNNDYTKNLIE